MLAVFPAPLFMEFANCTCPAHRQLRAATLARAAPLLPLILENIHSFATHVALQNSLYIHTPPAT